MEKLFNLCGYDVEKISYFGEDITLIKDNSSLFTKLINKLNLYTEYLFLFFLKKNINLNMTILEFLMNKKFKANNSNIRKARWIRCLLKSKNVN